LQETCNEYAAQTMFCQSQAYLTENKSEKVRFFWLFYFQKSQIGNPATQELRMRIKYARKLSFFVMYRSPEN